MNATDIEFDPLAEHLSFIGTLTTPAELHGFLCGRLCGGVRYGEDEWLHTAKEFLNPINAVETAQKTALAELYHQAFAQLQDHQLGFSLLLPDDDSAMSLRLESLGQWCHGFLNGFGTSGIGKDAELSSETAEALRDFAAFVQMDQDSEDENDNERDYLEVLEYVRIATLSVFMEMALNEGNIVAEANTTESEKEPNPTLH